MEKTEISHKLNDDVKVTGKKKKTLDNKQQTTSETSNLESASSSYNTLSENAESKGSLGNQNESGNPSEEPSRPQEQTLEEENAENETSLQSNHADNSGDSENVGFDVEVCDICGDAGRDDLLAICCKCTDGAEHTYCMRVMLDSVPEGDWVCEECKLEENNKRIIRQKSSSETGIEKDQTSGKRRAEELESSSSFKKRAVDLIDGSTKDVDRGKVKDSLFSNEPSESARSHATRPRLQSLKASLFKSSSFSHPNLKAKTKLVDEITLERQKSTKERSFNESREMGKSTSFRSTSTNQGRFGPSGSKVKMLPANSTHVQDHKSLKDIKERSFERTNSVKSSGSNSVASTPKGDKLPKSQILSSVDQKSTALKDDNPSKLSIPKESSNLADVIKETTNSSHLGTGSIPSPSGVPSQNNKQTGQTQGSFGNNASVIRNSKEVKNRENNKLKDAIEAALLKKPGIYRKNNESSVSTVNNNNNNNSNNNNNEVPVVDRAPYSRNSGSLTSAEVANEWHGQSLRNSNVDHSKQSNGNSFKQPMMPPAEGKHLTAGLSSLDDVALSSLLKNQAIPDHECIWQGGFEINRSGKTVEFWDGLQGHLSSCASARVFEAVNKLPNKILLNGVSRVSAWPTQFENSGVKEDNIAIYFFAKDLESYEKSYQVLLDEMIRGDLALIGSINGVELLIFPSNRLPEKSNRWNMLFFLWGVFRGKKKNPLQVPDKISSPEDLCLPESTNKDKNVDSETEGSLKLQTFSQEKSTNDLSTPLGCVNVVVPVTPVTDGNTSLPNKTDGQDLVKPSQNQEPEPKKRPFIDLSKDDDDDDDDDITITTTTNQINTWRDPSGRMTEDENINKKQKSESYGQNSNSDNVFNTSQPKENSNGERHFFPLIGSSERPEKKVKLSLDLNECLDGETDDIIMREKDDEDDDVASSLSLSLAFSPPGKDDEDRGKGKIHSMLLFRDMVDK